MFYSWSQDKYRDALEFAAIAHKNQRVPGKPFSYVIHLSSVCMEIIHALAEETVENPDLAVQCALLHDVIEDTAVGYAEVKNAFGVDVADGVLALSKDAALPKARRIPDSLERILRCPREIGMIKLADRITNLQRPPSYWSRDRAEYYREEAGLILAKLAHCSGSLAGRLENKIQVYRSFIDAM